MITKQLATLKHTKYVTAQYFYLVLREIYNKLNHIARALRRLLLLLDIANTTHQQKNSTLTRHLHSTVTQSKLGLKLRKMEVLFNTTCVLRSARSTVTQN